MFTTMERLQGKIGFDGAVIRFNDQVLTARPTWRKEQGRGYEASIYTSLGEEEFGFEFSEARLEHPLTSPTLFTDTGHTIEWALKTLNTRFPKNTNGS